MYADNTLTPKEATRLCVLGTLAQEGKMTYSALATAARHFIARIAGPSLDLMGQSIELLKYEGLIAAEGSGLEDDALMEVTDKGLEELHALLRAKLRSGSGDLNSLIVALKFRFLHLLPRDDRIDQAEMLAEAWETELARLEDLRAHHSNEGGFLVPWLDYEIDEHERHLEWLESFRTGL